MQLVRRLDQALRFWEDFFFFTEMMRVAAKGRGYSDVEATDGPYIHSAEFRKFLLERHPEFDWDRFNGGEEARLKLEREIGTAGYYLPSALHGWTVSSRRSFALSDDLQLMLMATSLERMCWSDIKWPFSSFFVELSVPLIHRNNSFDGILVYRATDIGGDGHLLILFSRQFDEHVFISQLRRQEMLNLQRRGKWDKLTRLVLQIKDRIGSVAPLQIVGSAHSNDLRDIPTLISKRYEREVAEGGRSGDMIDFMSVVESAYRIVFGLCQYVASAKEAGVVEKWQRVPKAKAQGYASITDEADVCAVVGHHNFSFEEKTKVKEIIRSGGDISKAISAHFRIGHWRRPPGKGNDANYPKTVWVRPTLVLGRDLGAIGLPGGSKQAV
jgi:hypothetical protein